MPRRNKRPKHTRFQLATNSESAKVRYPTKHAAENAAEVRMLQVMGLELAVYQGMDGGWYLTSQTHED